MPGKTKTMEQIRNIISQRNQGNSIRSIALNFSISRNTVRSYLRLIEQSDYSLKEALDLPVEQLAGICCRTQDGGQEESSYGVLHQKLPHYVKELKRRHVTRQILWEEYREECPSGYGYTRFCYYLNHYVSKNDVTAIFTHRPGEKVMVDFAGDPLSYVDRHTGEEIKCQVLVSVLPHSSYIYAEALGSQNQQDFLTGLNHIFIHLGGVPPCVVCDNLKSAVKKANRYEPQFTELIEQLSLHYNTTFMATRVRKPRDKASVESSVNTVYQRVYTRLRNRQFFSLKQVNAGLKEALQDLNSRNLQGRNYCRKEIFEKYERDKLITLPAETLEIKKNVLAKVQRNYHVILGEDMHQYSVPWQYAGKRVKITYTGQWAEIYLDHKRIALHQRDMRKHAYSTLKEHMPDNHRAVWEMKGWDAAYFIREARKNGPNTQKAIGKVLESKSFPEQTYNSCLGILRLADKYGAQRLESACKLVLGSPRINYGIINNILTNHMDQLSDQQACLDFTTPEHENLRGENYYS